MNAILEKYALTADVALVTAMFLTYFAGYIGLAHIAILGFSALTFVQVLEQYRDQYRTVEA
jgi:hypothetical protein